MHRAGHLRERDVALTEALVERLGIRQAEVGEDLGQGRGPDTETVELPLEHLLALLAVLHLVLLAEPRTHFRAIAR